MLYVWRKLLKLHQNMNNLVKECSQGDVWPIKAWTWRASRRTSEDFVILHFIFWRHFTERPSCPRLWRWAKAVSVWTVSHYSSMDVLCQYNSRGPWKTPLLLQKERGYSWYSSPQPQPTVVYFFQVGALFCTENAKFWPFLALLLQICAMFSATGLNNGVMSQNWQIWGMKGELLYVS